MELQVINSDGWEKSFSIEKALVRVGSGLSSDVRISGAGIAPMHLQFFVSQADDPKRILTVLDKGVKVQRGVQEIEAAPMSNMDLLAGDVVCLRGYRIMVCDSDNAKRLKQSDHMRAGIKLSSETLENKYPVSGTVLLENLGTASACQFVLSVEGLPEECLEIGPMPLLHPGNKSSVSFTITHKGVIPKPGFQKLVFKISAANQYKGESIIFPVSLFVLPYVESSFSLMDDSEMLVAPITEEKSPESESKKSRSERRDEVIKDKKVIKEQLRAGRFSEAGAVKETPPITEDTVYQEDEPKETNVSAEQQDADSNKKLGVYEGLSTAISVPEAFDLSGTKGSQAAAEPETDSDRGEELRQDVSFESQTIESEPFGAEKQDDFFALKPVEENELVKKDEPESIILSDEEQNDRDLFEPELSAELNGPQPVIVNQFAEDPFDDGHEKLSESVAIEKEAPVAEGLSDERIEDEIPVEQAIPVFGKTFSDGSDPFDEAAFGSDMERMKENTEPKKPVVISYHGGEDEFD